MSSNSKRLVLAQIAKRISDHTNYYFTFLKSLNDVSGNSTSVAATKKKIHEDAGTRLQEAENKISINDKNQIGDSLKSGITFLNRQAQLERRQEYAALKKIDPKIADNLDLKSPNFYNDYIKLLNESLQSAEFYRRRLKELNSIDKKMSVDDRRKKMYEQNIYANFDTSFMVTLRNSSNRKKLNTSKLISQISTELVNDATYAAIEAGALIPTGEGFTISVSSILANYKVLITNKIQELVDQEKIEYTDVLKIKERLQPYLNELKTDIVNKKNTYQTIIGHLDITSRNFQTRYDLDDDIFKPDFSYAGLETKLKRARTENGRRAAIKKMVDESFSKTATAITITHPQTKISTTQNSSGSGNKAGTIGITAEFLTPIITQLLTDMPEQQREGIVTGKANLATDVVLEINVDHKDFILNSEEEQRWLKDAAKLLNTTRQAKDFTDSQFKKGIDDLKTHYINQFNYYNSMHEELSKAVRISESNKMYQQIETGEITMFSGRDMNAYSFVDQLAEIIPTGTFDEESVDFLLLNIATIATDKTIDKLNRYLTMFASFIMFDDYGAALEYYGQQMEAEQKANIIHLYNLNGILFPSSMVLRAVADGMQQFLETQTFDDNNKLISADIHINAGLAESLEKTATYNTSDTYETYYQKWEDVKLQAASSVRVKTTLFYSFYKVIKELLNSI